MATPISLAFQDFFTNTTLRNHFTQDDEIKIFREEIPPHILESENISGYFPFARINDISNNRTGYASNRATYTESILQFAAWDETFAKLDQLDYKLNSIMAEMGYVETFAYTTIDPDISKPYMIKRYRYQKDV